ncbi:MAG: hypothetical protein WC905_04320 [Patescibacteria group bacterium]|jgi:hypothetical protein
MIDRRKIRIFWLVFLAFLVLVFLFFKVVPTGRITYRYTWPRVLHSGKGFISDFKPGERLDVANKKSLKIVADPVYFSLFTPRRFDRATVTVKYRHSLSSTTPIIELGVLQDKFSGRYELRPLENRLLDDWRFNWNRLLEADGQLVLQAEPIYTDSAEFFRDLDSGRLKNCSGAVSNCLAVYNYDLSPKFSLPNYRMSLPVTISQPLRGAHQFYVYFTGGKWRLSFDFVDLNQDKEADPIKVFLLSGSDVIDQDFISDENPDPTGGREENRSLILQGESLPAGVYKAEIKVSDDIVIRSIQSSSEKLVFINRIWPVSSPNLPLKILTDGTYLQAQTLNPASLGDIAFGQQTVPLTAAYRPFSSAIASDYARREIKLDRDDIILDNNGIFAFSADSFFNPGLKKIDRYFRPGDQIKYIVADYSAPRGDHNLRTATAQLDLRGASREKGKYTFLFSVPGLMLSDGETPSAATDYLEIKEIKIKLQGKTLWQKIFRH